MLKKKPYQIIFAVWLLSVVWLFFHQTYQNHSAESSPDICFMKVTTGIACPACGTTRSVSAIMQGEFETALMLNPLGYLAAFILLLFPVLMIYEFYSGKTLIHNLHQGFNHRMRKGYALQILLALLILANWFWNIKKDL